MSAATPDIPVPVDAGPEGGDETPSGYTRLGVGGPRILEPGQPVQCAIKLAGDAEGVGATGWIGAAWLGSSIVIRRPLAGLPTATLKVETVRGWVIDPAAPARGDAADYRSLTELLPDDALIEVTALASDLAGDTPLFRGRVGEPAGLCRVARGQRDGLRAALHLQSRRAAELPARAD